MTNQELLNKVYRQARKQGRPSVDDMGQCVYRNDDGDKCFAGFLLADEHYREEFEGAGVDGKDLAINFVSEDGLTVVDALILSGVNKSQMDLVGNLQGIHDDWSNRSGAWGINLINHRFANLASTYDLEMPTWEG